MIFLWLDAFCISISGPSVCPEHVSEKNAFYLCVIFFSTIEKNTKFTSYFCAIGFFNEADTLEFSSILIYSFLRQHIYAQRYGRKPY
jgi:hypothetical protein